MRTSEEKALRAIMKSEEARHIYLISKNYYANNNQYLQRWTSKIHPRM
jgi:hypothetical protein